MPTIRFLSGCLILASSMAPPACQADEQAPKPEYCLYEGHNYSQGAVITHAGQVLRCVLARVGEPGNAPTPAWVALNPDRRTLAVPVESADK